MKTLHKTDCSQIHQFSAIFLQIGIVFSLFVAYCLLEFKTEQKLVAQSFKSQLEKPLNWEDFTPSFEKEKPKKQPTKKKKIIKKMLPKKIDNQNKKDLETIIEPKTTATKSAPNFLDTFDEIPEVEKPEEDNFIYKATLFTPVFKGCEGLEEIEKKSCFQNKMQKFVQRKFDVTLASNLGLSAGKKKIYIYFVINKLGNIESIRIRAPHPKLKQEAIKVVSSLPKFKPALKNGKPINVEYLLPLVFKVD